MKTTFHFLAATALAAALLAIPAEAQPLNVAERLTALKASIGNSQANLRHYQWIQTTEIRVRGELKSTKQERCYFGDDGKVQKIELGSSADASSPRGPLRRRIAAQKKEELTDYMRSAVALVKTYVPPNPWMIQSARDAGNISLQVLEPGRRARLTIRNYAKRGDNFALDVNLVANRPQDLNVATYLSDPSDAVTLHASMGQLNNGANYPAQILLNAPSKKLTVSVQNGGYQRIN